MLDYRNCVYECLCDAMALVIVPLLMVNTYIYPLGIKTSLIQTTDGGTLEINDFQLIIENQVNWS